MSLVRPMLRLLAVAIVMIVAGLGASGAQAHEGHAHRPVVHGHAAAASVTAAGKALLLRAEAGEREPCALCCMACCHSVLMPAEAAAPPPSTRRVRLAVLPVAIPPGLVPEALPRPPRPLA